MDVYCPQCGEPCDRDHFHSVAEDQRRTCREVEADFRQRGCDAIGSSHNDIDIRDPRAMAAQAMYEVCGDDMDGAAAMLEDLCL